MATTGVRGSGFKSPRDLTGRMHQQQLEAQKRKQKQEADIASGRTYEAGHREGYADGWDTGWDAGQQAGIQLMIDKMEAGDFDYIYYPEDEAEEAEING